MNKAYFKFWQWAVLLRVGEEEPSPVPAFPSAYEGDRELLTKSSKLSKRNPL